MVIFIVSLALFMEAVDSTVLNTAIPAMSQSLQVNPIDLKIALISYLLSLAILIPISGWMADKFGIKRIFITAVAVFTLSSLWCGYAHNLFELVIARAVQGIGGSLALPVGRLILVRTYPRHHIMNIMSRVVMVASLGLMLGPVLGGLITHYLSWPWVFWINIPVGILAILLALDWLPAMPPEKVPPLDIIGFLLFGSSLASFTFGLSALSESVLPISVASSILSASVILMFFYVIHSYKRPHPIVKTELFRYRTFKVSSIGNLVCRLGFGGIPFLLPIMLQVVLGRSSLASGLLIAPIAVGVLLIKVFSTRILQLLGFKKLLIINTLFMALSLWSFMLINNDTHNYEIVFMTFVFGFLLALQYSGMNALAYADIPPNYLSAATSFTSTLQQVTQSFGVATGALLIHYFSRQSGENFLLTTHVFHETFFVMGLLTLLSILVFLILQHGDGKQMLSTQPT